MRMKKISLLLLIVSVAIVFSACGKESDNEKDSAAKPQKEEKVTNEENVKAVVEAVKDPDVRYKIAINDEMYIFVIEDSFASKGTAYGFDDPDTGTSIYAYASKKDLNEEQASAISSLLGTSAVDENGKQLKDIGEYYPDDFRDGRYPYKGVDLDYMTLSNIETEPSEKGDNYTKITADVTVHLHLMDGTEESKTFKSSAEPEIGDTQLDEEMVKEALSADVMNEEIPTEDRFIYEDKKE